PSLQPGASATVRRLRVGNRVRAPLAHDDRARGQVAQALVARGEEDGDDSGDVEGEDTVHEAKDVAHCARSEVDGLAAELDHTEAERAFAGCSSGSENFERDVVADLREQGDGAENAGEQLEAR